MGKSATWANQGTTEGAIASFLFSIYLSGVAEKPYIETKFRAYSTFFIPSFSNAQQIIADRRKI
jgi:hypothetical protein